MAIVETRALPWRGIDSVFLDMDGTLLDLYFDNYFWCEHVPRRYAERHGLDPEVAKRELYPRFHRMEGTLQWYCLDYWSAQLDLDVAALKHEVADLIAVHPHVEAFLKALGRAGKRVRLVTNAHGESLSLKLERTGLRCWVEDVACAHAFGLPKESPVFWDRLEREQPFDPARTLLIDDNVAVLRAARTFGIAHLLTVLRPDTRQPPRADGEFPGIHGFDELLPVPG